MTVQRHGKPYCWTTHITRLLAGEDQCGYAPWFKAHYTFKEVERGDFDLAGWKADHNLLVQARAAELVSEGWTVTVEDQNKFTVVGRTAILGGKADIVARREDERLVVDCKGGNPRDSDFWQVLIYLLELPQFEEPPVPGSRWRGEVCYRDHRIQIEPEELNQTRRDQIFLALRTIGSQTRPPKVPSVRECAYCKVPKSDCPERIETEEQPVTTSDF
jgi:hypothetical protein